MWFGLNVIHSTQLTHCNTQHINHPNVEILEHKQKLLDSDVIYITVEVEIAAACSSEYAKQRGTIVIK